jgi:hypothetical protein
MRRGQYCKSGGEAGIYSIKTEASRSNQASRPRSPSECVMSSLVARHRHKTTIPAVAAGIPPELGIVTPLPAYHSTDTPGPSYRRISASKRHHHLFCEPSPGRRCGRCHNREGRED